MGHHVTPLELEFSEDHRKLTRGVPDISDALKRGAWPDAVTRAKELDRVGGPHIIFEEQVMYPQVAKIRGTEYVTRFYDEHKDAIDGLRLILQHEDQTGVTDKLRAEILSKLQTGLDHAVSCGSLLSYLTAMDAGTQLQLLERLRGAREQGMSMLEFKRSQISSH